MTVFHCERCGADLQDLQTYLYLNEWGESLCMLCYYVVEETRPQWTVDIEERIAERLTRRQPEQRTLNV